MSSLSSPERRGAATVRVMVVDDQAVFRRVARAVVEATAGFEPVGDAASGAEALISADQLHPDLVLMDVQMPGMDGFEAARRLADCHPESVVVLLSLHDSDEFGPLVVSCGASAFLRKQDLAPAVLRHLWTMHGGRRCARRRTL